MPPWNAQQVWEPTPSPPLLDPDQRDDEVAPEDLPINSGCGPSISRAAFVRLWIFNPTLTAGTLYDSNVFSSNSNKQSDIAGLVGAALRAYNSSEKNALDFHLDTQSLAT